MTALLAAAGFGAGFVDAIAGGGGLLTVPALLAAGLPPILMLGTNKAQSTIGTSIAVWRYHKGGLIEWRLIWRSILGSAIGAALGATLVQHIHASTLRAIIPVLMIGTIIYFLVSPRMTDADAHARLSAKSFAPIGGLMGFYDGFFGPGTGSITAACLVELVGMGLKRATGNTKALNLTSNIVALILFAAAGQMLWLVALIMGLANCVGAWLGSHLALKHGAAVIRPLLILVSLALTVHVALDPAGPVRHWLGY